ncbi:hypothetical protein K488DRAFT_50131 [Vararia minispora EC-137]|uniref:Uncharacterized protein n=1 Tax=Vararia minispora EC-137 TaxID=1314806 RepID=A0ACB8QKJ5_9AGAM|nr:hypothetical protein K488DRAFT_50131 [Vararia minispora EC-137]
MTAANDLEAYVLLTIFNASLITPSGPIYGDLALEYVTYPVQFLPQPAAEAPDVFLVLRIGAFETVLDPAHAVDASVLPTGEHKYVLRGWGEPADLVLLLQAHDKSVDDLETFHGILTEYGGVLSASTEPTTVSPAKVFVDQPVADTDLRGRFVLVNADSHEVVGTLDHNVRVHEDPVIYESGHEHGPIVVEMPDADDELDEMEVIVRAVPPEERGWIMNGAMFASHVISGTTTLLTSAMDAASNLYISRATPSPHANPSPKDSTSLPPPSRTMVLLQSPTTRKNLTRIHTATGHAVKLSSKAAALVNDAIDRAVGNSSAKGKTPAPPTMRAAGEKPPLPVRPLSGAPPPYSVADEKQGARLGVPAGEKPALPPRRSPVPSRSASPLPPAPTRARLALSAALVLSALSASSQQLVESGGAALSAAVTHKYGVAAGANVGVAAGAARDVVLVYVDVRGMGRRAIVRRAVKGFAKGRMRKGVRA